LSSKIGLALPATSASKRSRARADGYTLLLVGSFNTINATLYDKLNFNFIRDIAPVASVMRYPYVMVVNPSLPAKSVPEFVAYAKANPGKLNMASPGTGTGDYIAGELFKIMAGVDIVHVSYRGIALALSDLLGGQVQVSFPSMPSAIQFIRAGQLRALAVVTATRSDALPDVPTVAEFLPGYEASSWYGLGAPKATPAEIIADPKNKARLANLGGDALALSPADFSKLIADETEKWGKLIRTLNIKAE
jgi:tripartite-type tricarboxylate transporter receptor subunit TctC